MPSNPYEQLTLPELAREFAQRDLTRKRLEKEARAEGKEASAAAAVLLDRMADEGVPEISVQVPEGKAKVKIQSLIWASAAGKPNVAEEFAAMGMGDMVSVNSTRLSGWVRNIENELAMESDTPGALISPEELDAALPEGLRGQLTIERRTKVRT